MTDETEGLPLKKERNSSIKLLKILAMFMIVISHVAQTLASPHPNLLYPVQMFFDATHTARDFEHFIILLFRHLGAFGNNIFFICSAWFLCGSREAKTQRIFQILLDVWILSVLSIGISLCTGINLPKKQILTLLFPTTFSINWYATCYILFLAVLPLLNLIIANLSRKSFRNVCAVCFFIYCGICAVSSYLFYYSEIVNFITIYFVIAYVKIYLPQKTQDIKLNAGVFVISLVLLLLAVLSTNMLGFKISFFEHNALHWARNNNPLIIFMSFSLFNLFNSKSFCSRTVNYISSLTLFIYLIHEGQIVRDRFRPFVWSVLYERFGYSKMSLLALGFALVLFTASVLLSALYRETFARASKAVSSKAFRVFKKLFT